MTDPELAPGDIRAVQILSGALAMGVVMFLGAILFLTQNVTPAEAQPDAYQQMQLLSAVHGFMAVSSFMMGFVLFNQRFSPSAFRQAFRGRRPTPEELAGTGLTHYRGAHIIRMAMFEGPALFGLVIVFLSHNGGVLSEHPELWLNALSGLAMLAATAAAFPTERGIQRVLREAVERVDDWEG